MAIILSSAKSTGDLEAFVHQYSRLLALGFSIVLLSTSTLLHFSRRGSLAEFILAILTIVPISTAIRSTTKDMVFRLQNLKYEFLAGLLNGLFGYFQI
jgi:hypothetical protein